MKKIVLASASPRRRELLKKIVKNFISTVSQVDEAGVSGKTPEEFARNAAQAKAAAVAKQFKDALIIGADTIVVRDGQVLGKPESRDQARTMLALLSGARHQVITAFCVVRADGTEDQEAITTEVCFKELAPAEIEAYLDTGEWHDKAGSYAVQGRAAYIVRSLVGSYTNVVGLPLCEAVEALERAGVGRE